MTRQRSPDFWGDGPTGYELWKSPLSPCSEDLAVMIREVRQVYGRLKPDRLDVLQLGVTPGIALMKWPAGTDLVAVDRSRSMIESHWPGDVSDKRINRTAVQGEWRSLKPNGSLYHVVIGDGPFHNMPDERNHAVLRDALHQLVAGGGRVIIRFFVRPPSVEEPHELVARLRAGEFPSFHAFKFCLLMALQPASGGCVVLDDVWEFWESLKIKHQELAESQNWSVPSIDSIHAYKGQTHAYCFLTEREIENILSEKFDIVHCWHPSYSLGERCPIFSLAPL